MCVLFLRNCFSIVIEDFQDGAYVLALETARKLHTLCSSAADFPSPPQEKILMEQWNMAKKRCSDFFSFSQDSV